MHAINVNISTTSARTTNRYACVENIAGLAGISGVSTDPFNWGIPSLSFSSLSSVRDVTPSRRTDRRFSTSYNWTRPYKTHQLRFGGDFRFDRSASQTDANASLLQAAGFAPSNTLESGIYMTLAPGAYMAILSGVGGGPGFGVIGVYKVD